MASRPLTRTVPRTAYGGLVSGSHGLQAFGKHVSAAPEVKILLKPYIKLFWLVVNAWDTYLWANRCLAKRGRI